MDDIICFSQNKSALLFKSVNIKTYVLSNANKLMVKVKEEIELNKPKIIIYDIPLIDYFKDLIKKYEDTDYPIFICLPIGGEVSGAIASEIKKNIEKTIGISGF